jgi:hypothetical protein
MMFKTIVRSLSLIIILILVILPSLFIEIHPGSAQSNSAWSPYQRIHGYDDRTLPPYFIVDPNQTVHAFTSQWVGVSNPQLAIVYRQWILETGWTVPVDIILSPLSQARLTGVYLDADGIVHLIFFGGDDLGANIYYSYAPLGEAGKVTAWSKPVSIGRRAITPTTAALASDGHGNFIVVYSGDIEGNGLYAVSSPDSGKTWTDPASIYLTFDDTLFAYGIRLSLGEAGRIHAVWNVVDGLGHNQAGYYAHLDLDGWNWSQPLEFAQGIGIDVGMGIDNVEIIEHKNTLFIMYNNGIPPTGVPPGEWMVTSKDNGLTWSVPIRAFPQHVGRNGTISFVVDSQDDLHLVFANRIPITVNGGYDSIGGIFHSEWKGTSWSEPEAIITMLESLSTTTTLPDSPFPAFAPFDASAVVYNGNVLLATWRTDPGFPGNGVWYSYKILNASEFKPTISPTVGTQSNLLLPAETAQPQLSNSGSPTPTVQPLLSNQGNTDQGDIAGTTANSLWFGALPVFMILFFILIINQLSGSKRH